jgi:hypothetical protein
MLCYEVSIVGNEAVGDASAGALGTAVPVAAAAAVAAAGDGGAARR